jgi:hypothetical protein
MSSRLWLCLPPLLVFLGDQAVTLWCQPCQYWAGDYSIAREGSPHGLWLLNQHPLAYVGGVTGYMLAFTTGLLFLPRRLARIAALAIVLGHSWGMATWLWHDDWWTESDAVYNATLLLFVAVAVVTATCLDWSDRRTLTEPVYVSRAPAGRET